jgi:phytoene dehydrogenase-like protein
LEANGLEWVQPFAPVAHPLDGGEVAVVERSVERTAEALGEDAGAYRKLLQYLVDDWEKLFEDLLRPIPVPPRYPVLLARFGLQAILPAASLARLSFRGEAARAVFAGMAAHSMLSLDRPLTGALGLVMTTMAHAVGWPMVRGGTQRLAEAMASHFSSLGGETRLNQQIDDFDELPPARAFLFDVTPRQLLNIAGKRLPAGYRRQLERFRYGVGVFKVDYALDGSIPWENENCNRAATLHIGGTFDEIVASEKTVWRGDHPEKPFVLLAQQSCFDPSRAPAGKHTAWAYCHVPHGSTVDMTGRITAQIERFAPGFRERILACHTYNTTEIQQYNPNYIGGDIYGGAQDLLQFFFRPVPRLNPYSTPAKGIYICSSSTPPGPGVHGMCGYHAAQVALSRGL